MDKDAVMGLFVIIIGIIGALISIGIAGFVCWGIYRLITLFL